MDLDAVIVALLVLAVALLVLRERKEGFVGEFGWTPACGIPTSGPSEMVCREYPTGLVPSIDIGRTSSEGCCGALGVPP
jgi:hypothetical protein